VEGRPPEERGEISQTSVVVCGLGWRGCGQPIDTPWDGGQNGQPLGRRRVNGQG
jgi:hypothetical protein